MVIRTMRTHTGKWNASKYKILATLVWMRKPATCAMISHWSGIPRRSVWRDVWRYHQFKYVRIVGNSRPYRYRIALKGRRFLIKINMLRLIETGRLDNELAEHRLFLQQKDMDEFKARLANLIRRSRENGDTQI